MTIRSMTGFARVQASSEQGDVTVTVKSVNHRGLDIHFQMPDELDALESSLREVVKRFAKRGHLQVNVVYVRPQMASSALNRELLEAYVSACREAAKDLGIHSEPDLNMALSIPGMFRAGVLGELDQAAKQLLLSAMEEVMEALNAFREREGAELAAEMSTRTAAIQRATAQVEELRTQALPAFQARLSERLAELLGNAGIEPVRLMQEAAILTDRSDISEELMRLKVHSGQLEELLRTGGEVGKKVDFLLQEMGREANTILSKTNGIGELGLRISDLALAIKADIEKIREQSLNLE